MKLEIARGFFLAGALGITSFAAMAWSEPAPAVLSGLSGLSGQEYCRLPINAGAEAQVQPDQDLLLLMFGLTQGLKS
ncbi:MAG: hypothetical protein U5M72_12130 [Pseudomonas sp.]|nr:hypothetical protein [Pseudomonas sp.]